MKVALLSFLCLPVLAMAQNTLEPDQPIKIVTNAEGNADLLIADPENNRAFGQFGYLTETYVTFKGTPYFKDGFTQGEITLENGEKFSGTIGLNLEDLGVYDEHFKLLTPKFKTIEIFGTSLFVENIHEDGEPVILETIQGGEIQVLKKHEKTLFTSTKDLNSRLLKNDQKYLGSFSKTEEFILKIEDRYIPVSQNLKFFASLGKYEEKAYQLLEKNRFKLKTEKEVLEFVNALTANNV